MAYSCYLFLLTFRLLLISENWFRLLLLIFIAFLVTVISNKRYFWKVITHLFIDIHARLSFQSTSSGCTSFNLWRKWWLCIEFWATDICLPSKTSLLDPSNCPLTAVLWQFPDWSFQTLENGGVEKEAWFQSMQIERRCEVILFLDHTTLRTEGIVSFETIQHWQDRNDLCCLSIGHWARLSLLSK